jgi:hypothetical protein
LADIGLDRGQIRFVIDGLAAAPRRARHDHARASGAAPPAVKD